MVRIGVPLLLAALAVLAAPAAADNPVLNGIVGPGFSISLQDASRAHVANVAPGDYTFHVSDRSDEHNFDLTGPGVDKATGVGEIQDVDWDVTLAQGTYHYVCDAHPTTMKGSFTVGAVTPPAQTQKVSGSVGPGAKIVFSRSAKAGKTVITVRDRTAKDNFHLIGPGVNKKTGVKFRGTVTWTVTLKAGTYTFRSDAHSKLRGKTTVG
jgi:plastocyanin